MFFSSGHVIFNFNLIKRSFNAFLSLMQTCILIGRKGPVGTFLLLDENFVGYF